jgi:flagellar biosynthesis/type III secretory pathway chaperone
MTAHGHAGAAPASAGALPVALDRLVAILAEEEAALASGDRGALEDVIQRKSRSLLELTRLARADRRAHETRAGDDGRLPEVRRRLSRNAELLEMHLGAAREVGDLIAASVAREESDGTYGGPPAGAGGGRR